MYRPVSRSPKTLMSNFVFLDFSLRKLICSITNHSRGGMVLPRAKVVRVYPRDYIYVGSHGCFLEK